MELLKKKVKGGWSGEFGGVALKIKSFVLNLRKAFKIEHLLDMILQEIKHNAEKENQIITSYSLIVSKGIGTSNSEMRVLWANSMHFIYILWRAHQKGWNNDLRWILNCIQGYFAILVALNFISNSPMDKKLFRLPLPERKFNKKNSFENKLLRQQIKIPALAQNAQNNILIKCSCGKN